jgi:hypothetical protein
MIRAGTLLEKERSQRPAPNQPGIPERQGRIVLLVTLPPHGEQFAGKEQVMEKNQRVGAMADEVLARQARARAERTGEPFEEALEAVRKSEAGGSLRSLARGHTATREPSGGRRICLGSGPRSGIEIRKAECL